jgi:hypothetical protein
MQTPNNLPPNPKQVYGDKKPRLSLNPLSAAIAQSEAQFDGALKYGEANWRDQPVEAMTYVDAAIRHIQLYANGEKYTRDTKVQNLGAVMACCAILIDAELHNTLIDNRKHSPDACDALHRAEAMVQVLKDAQQDRTTAPPPNPAPVVSMDKYGKHEPIEKAALVCKPTDFAAHPGKYVKPARPVVNQFDHLPEDAFEVPEPTPAGLCCGRTVVTRCHGCPHGK